MTDCAHNGPSRDPYRPDHVVIHFSPVSVIRCLSVVVFDLFVLLIWQKSFALYTSPNFSHNRNPDRRSNQYAHACTSVISLHKSLNDLFLLAGIDDWKLKERQFATKKSRCYWRTLISAVRRWCGWITLNSATSHLVNYATQQTWPCSKKGSSTRVSISHAMKYAMSCRTNSNKKTMTPKKFAAIQ